MSNFKLTNFLSRLSSCVFHLSLSVVIIINRYFFNHAQSKGVPGLGTETLAQVKKRTLRDILCENTEISRLQKNVMHKVSSRNSLVSCSETNTLDFDSIAKEIINGDKDVKEDIDTTTTKTTTSTTTTTTSTTTTTTSTTTTSTTTTARPNRVEKPNPVEKPVQKPKPVLKPKPVQKPKPAQKPKPIQKPKPVQKPKPTQPSSSNKCTKDKLSFCKWLIPQCAVSKKTRRDCCKTCGGVHVKLAQLNAAGK